MLTFVSPLWLTAGLLACCGAVLFLSLRTVHRRKELAKFAAPHLLPQLTANVSQARRRLKNILFVLGLACLFIALARPQWGSRWIEVRSKGVDILIGFDVSKSMLAPDIKPSRLERAKLAVRDFTARLDGDRIGLLPFAGTSFLMCPLTTDYDAFNASLAALNTDAIPKGGTDIGQTIEDAVRVLAGELNHKILILITDGEDLSQNALRAAAVAKQEKMLIYTVGVGTPQGELVPLPGGGAGNFVKDERGGFVTSRLDEKTLAAVAETTGGIYVPLGSMGQGLDTVYERKLALIPKEEQAQRKKQVLLERFQWPLGGAALLLSLDFLLIGRRRKLRLPFIFTAGRRKKEQVAATAAVLLLYMFWSVPARADQGSDLFQAGKYEQAAQFYQNALTNDSDNPTLHFNLGSSLHQQKKYDAAAAEFTKALQSSDITLQAKSYFNRGISQYRAGEEAEKKADGAEAIQHLKQAEKSFAAAIKLAQEQQKKDKAARNQQKAKEKREQLEKQQKEQSQQSGKDDEKKEPKQQEKQQEGKEENKQNSGSEAKQKQQDSKEEKNNADRAEKQDDSAAQKQKDQEKQQQKAASVPDKGQQQKESTAGNQQKQAGAVEQNGKPPQSGGQDKDEVKIMGKMTEEEAGNLLDSLKAEQGELNFIPQEAADGNEVDRDW